MLKKTEVYLKDLENITEDSMILYDHSGYDFGYKNSNDIKEILEALKPQDEEFTKAGIKEYPLSLSIEEQKILLDCITNLQEKIKSGNNIILANKNRIKELKKNIKGYEQKITRLNNIIDTMLEYNIFKGECPLNYLYTGESDEEKAQDVFYEDECEKNCDGDYKKCWLKYFERLKTLK